MARSFSVRGDTRKPAYFRVSIDMSAFDTNTDGNTGGAVSPNGNYPTSEDPYITDLSSLATSTTRATTTALAASGRGQCVHSCDRAYRRTPPPR